MNRNLASLLAKNEVIGNQLVKKNDALALQDEKIKYLQLSLDERDQQYQQRVDDIRLLKLEIKTLRHEKSLLTKGIDNMTDLRQEVFNLERELNQERLRTRALEELMKTPQNIHRWRKLEDTDPSTLELIEQVHILQKQSLDKSQKLKEMQALCETQRNNLINSTDHGLKEEHIKLKKKLLVKNEKIKILIAELRMKEYQLEHRKQNVPARNKFVKSNSTVPIQRKYDDNRFCESAPVRLRVPSKYSAKSPTDKTRRFLGGGFNIKPNKDAN